MAESPDVKTPRTVAKVSPLAGASLDAYLNAKAKGWQVEVIRRLDEIIRAAAPKATLAIKWSQPVYDVGGPFAYMRPAKAHLTLGFWRGADLDDPAGLLTGDGDRMRHLKISSPDAVDAEQVSAWVRQAVALNERLGNPAAGR